VGRTIRLNDENVTVVGVLPARFAFLGARDVWVNPADVVPEVFPNFRRDPGSDQSMHYLLLVGRLKPGVPLEQAQADLDPIALRLARQRDSDHRVRLASLHEQATGGVRPTLLVLLAAVGFVLLIACANVANLLLARATSRAREVAVRSALGASRWRLVRQLLTEGLLLAVLGGAVGLLLASWGMEVLRGLGPQELPRANGIRVDDAVLAFTLGVSILTSLLFGLAPALHAARSEARALAEGGAGGRASARGRLRGALVAAEMALSVLLLVGAGLLLRSFVRLLDVEPGFNPRGLVTVQIAFSSPRYVEPGRRAAFVRDLVPRLEALPGVEGVALANDLPLEGRDTTIYPAIEGRPGVGSEELILTGLHAVNPGYFRAMQIPLLRGRGFEDGDAGGAPRVALINRTAAERFWPAEDPLGRRLRQSDSESEPWLTVIGVAGDVKHDGLGEPPAPDVYVPFAQNAWAYAALALRAPADAEGLARLVRAEIQALDPDQPVFSVRTMEAVLGETLASRRFTLGMIGLFAALALALAAVGLYGVMAYLVTQRTREIGVRMALGARRSDILRLIVGQGMRLTAAGVALGLAGALGLTRFLSGLLFGVGPADAPTFAGVTAVLLLAALAACWLPARRAARVDPLTGLRHE
jgi:putative ABC transport system permease protein